MPPEDRIETAFKQWKESLAHLLSGDLLSHQNNETFEMTTKALWRTERQETMRTEITKAIEKLSPKFARLPHPAPMLLTLIQLKDRAIDVSIQEMGLLEWLKSNGDEPTTFQLINMVDTFDRHGTNTEPMIETIIKNMNDQMDGEMLKALGFWLASEREKYLGAILRKFAELKDKSILKEFVKMNGRRAVLEMMEFLRPGEVKKVLSARNEPPPWKSKPLTDEEKAFKARLGLCYELAYKFVFKHPEAKLIHGSIRGSGEEKRIKHAWCEVGDKVFDAVLGKMVPKWLYQEMFNAETTKTFTHEQALINLVKNKNYGPW